MMNTEKLAEFQESESQKIFAHYCHYFPADERRNEQQFTALFEKDSVEVLSIRDDQEPIGYCILWQLSDFVFIEHLEIFESHRAKGWGSQFLQLLKETHPKIVLETEPEDWNEWANLRIDFYFKNDFRILTKEYTQPAYDEDKNPLHLWLLANFKVKHPYKVVSQIYHEVYEK